MDFLETIRQHKLAEVAERKGRGGPQRRCDVVESSVRFSRALKRGRVAVIAEIKRRSPSKGELRVDVDIARTAKGYNDNGAAAISVLTDERFFGGSLNDLLAVCATVDVPVLRKDFVVDPFQILEAADAGADAVLLIVRLLSESALREMLALAHETGLEALVETHTADEIAVAVAAGARIIGVNNRNLNTFAVDLETAIRLRPLIPDDRVTVAESGIATAGDVHRLRDAGYDAVLVGETLMRADDAGALIREWTQ